jgi:prepilin-type N-terminal cleavage/methylation domain-containing protein
VQDFKRLSGSSFSSLHRGYTVLELIIVLSIAGLLMAIAIPRARFALDRIVVHSAAGDVAAVLSTARSLALAGHSAVAVDVDSASGILRIRRGAELVLSRSVGRAHGVRVGGNRDSLTYDPRGLGRGAANLSIVIRRRSAAETVFVSRLGRVR